MVGLSGDGFAGWVSVTMAARTPEAYAEAVRQIRAAADDLAANARAFAPPSA